MTASRLYSREHAGPCRLRLRQRRVASARILARSSVPGVGAWRGVLDEGRMITIRHVKRTRIGVDRTVHAMGASRRLGCTHLELARVPA